MDTFEAQLRKDIAQVIEDKGEIKKYGRNLIGFTGNVNDYVPEILATWHIFNGTATRKVVTESAYDDSYTKSETVYPNFGVANATEFMKLIKEILNPLAVEKPKVTDLSDFSDIPF